MAYGSFSYGSGYFAEGMKPNPFSPGPGGHGFIEDRPANGGFTQDTGTDGGYITDRAPTGGHIEDRSSG